MSYRIAALSVFVGIVIVSFCIGQGKPSAKSQAVPDVKVSDNDKIGSLQVQVAELQKKLAALTQKYDTHTHPLRSLEVAQLPSSIECDQTVAQWAPADTARGSVDKVCRQLMPRNISVLVPGRESIVTGPPRP